MQQWGNLEGASTHQLNATVESYSRKRFLRLFLKNGIAFQNITELYVNHLAAITFQVAKSTPSKICPMLGLGADFRAENGKVYHVIL